jgi:hypothetical protein
VGNGFGPFRIAKNNEEEADFLQDRFRTSFPIANLPGVKLFSGAMGV